MPAKTRTPSPKNRPKTRSDHTTPPPKESMETLDHDFQMHTRQGAGDEKLYVVFHPHYVQDVEKTALEGRPIFEDAVFIKIITPGDRDNIINRPIRPEDKFRFPKQWAQFENGQAELGSGTRLEEWTLMSRSMVEELRYLGFRTVEHVAEAGDQVLSKVPGLREFQSRAKVWLAKAKEAAGDTKLQSELEKRDAQIAALEEQVTQLARMAQAPEGATLAPGATTEAVKKK